MQQDIHRKRDEISHFLKEVNSFSKLEALEFRLLANVSRVSKIS